MKVFFSNDVEHTSVSGAVWKRIAKQVDEDGLPRLLELYDKYEVRSTFFVLGQLAELKPNIVKQIVAHGQEVGSHGYQHDYRSAFDMMTLEEQIAELRHSKDLLEQIGGQEVVSFRAPALRVNSDTPMALREAGFKFDSSVAPQRMDAFMSLGANKKQWLKAPRAIYETAIDNLARKGKSGIVEVPVSSYGVPYIGTVMRIAPYSLLPMTRRLLYWESQQKDTPITFLYHPSEAVQEIEEEYTPQHRAQSKLGYLLSDVLRAKVKLRNLDHRALTLLEKELKFWSERGGEFCMIKDNKIIQS
ncbi:MAG: polysaccharide deacetylase family protein [Paludibacteraceae bacterium]|nr:polysaccharide deacetylase family protein [Paludibacteraceae bacterium]